MSEQATGRPWEMRVRAYNGLATVYIPAEIGSQDERFYNGDWVADGVKPEWAALLIKSVNCHEAHQEVAMALRALLDSEWMVSHDWGGNREAVMGRAEKALAALSEEKGPAPQDELAWLIERGQAVNHSPTIWWRGGDSREMNDWPDCWTDNANLARRFHTRDYAEAIASKVFGGSIGIYTSVSVTEHVFLAGAPPKAQDLGEKPKP